MHKFSQKEIIGIVSLLIHAAKIDEIYTDNEKKIISNFVDNVADKDMSVQKIISEAEKLEADSNQLLSYTKIIKDSHFEMKKEVIEKLWKILISDNNVDQYDRI